MNQDPLFQYLLKNRTSFSQQMCKQGDRIKRYSRFLQIMLPTPERVDVSFSDMVLARKSVREYSDEPLRLQDVSTLLFWSAGRIDKENEETESNERRVYPSGGGKYPLELYVLVLKNGEIERGVYHYNIETHALEQLIMVDVDEVLAQMESHDYFSHEGGMIVLFSFVKNRSVEKYGALAYKLAFMEAGHVSQNMYLLAPSLDLACCGMGMNDTVGLNNVLRLDGTIESVFYGMAIGKK